MRSWCQRMTSSPPKTKEMTSIPVGGLECNRNWCSLLLNKIAAIGLFIMQKIIVNMISSFENDKSLLYARTHSHPIQQTQIAGACIIHKKLGEKCGHETLGKNVNNTSFLLHLSTKQSANLNNIINICHTFRCRFELFPAKFQCNIQIWLDIN